MPQTPRPKPSSEGVGDRQRAQVGSRSPGRREQRPARWARSPWPVRRYRRSPGRSSSRHGRFPLSTVPAVLARLGEGLAAGGDDSKVAPCAAAESSREPRTGSMRPTRLSRRAEYAYEHEPSLPRGLIRLAGGQVSWLPGFAPRLPEDAVASSVAGRRVAAVPRVVPGHSGGTAPDSHRTSLDHRPYFGASLTGAHDPG